ncbi:MAG: peptidylprolyl isomerase [Chitinophaga sp.]|jgi:peptidyl-prolyl cis-trans isomerase D|nr:peptidylprolyl isomerase [Chitinophaga sp.]
MSAIQKIRDKGAWIMFGLIALALIAFILQDRSLGGRGGLFGSNANTLGKVNGEVIKRDEFEKKLTMYGQGSRNEQMIGQLWNAQVNELIMQKEYDKLGIVCTAKELGEALFSEETSPFKQIPQFSDPKTGQFNADAAKQWYTGVYKKSKDKEMISQVYEGFIYPTIQRVLQQKYQALQTQSMYVPKWLVEKTQADNNAIASVSYVYVPYTSVSDSTVKVTDDEIMNYAKKHKKEFERDEETRSISYVTFDAAASAKDSATVYNSLNEIKSDFTNTTDVKSFIAKTGSDMPYNDGYINKSEIKQKAIDSIAKLSVGQVYGPYLDGDKYVLAKQVGMKILPDSAKVRHILIATHQQDPQSGQLIRVRDDSTARKIMDTVEMQLKAGKPFDTVCAKFSDDGNKDKGGVYDYFPSSKMVPEFTEFAFQKSVGSKGVITTTYGLHYVEVLGQKGSGPAYKIAYIAKPIVISNETDNNAQNAALQFAANSRNKKAFDENAGKQNKVVLPANELKENDYSIMGLGESRKLIKWAYDHEAGDVTEQPEKIGDKYVVAIVTAVSKPGIPNVGLIRPLIEPIVKNEKKAKQIIDTKFKGNTLEALATSTATSVQKIDTLLFSNPFIPGIGADAKFTGASFNTNLKGKVSDPIAGTSGVFALKVENIFAKPAADDAVTVKQGLLQTQRMAAYRGLDALKKAAAIKDYRSKFY